MFQTSRSYPVTPTMVLQTTSHQCIPFCTTTPTRFTTGMMGQSHEKIVQNFELQTNLTSFNNLLNIPKIKYKLNIPKISM